MEALWKVEEKCKLTTQDALVLFSCTAFALIALCTAIILLIKRRKRNQMVNHRCRPGESWSTNWVKLRTKLRWSDHHKAPPQTPLLAFQKHSSLSPLWQRPILMGDKCELPKFSGLILYDQTGTLLNHKNINHQEKPATGITTTLKDLL